MTSRCRRISGAATRAEHAALYRQAVTLIARMQQRGRDLASEQYLPYGIAFDVEKLTWELQFFVKHFLEAYRGATIAPLEREALERRTVCVSPRSWPRSRACSVIATITAAT